MRTYLAFSSQADMLRELRQLAASTIIFDVEPLIAYWYGTQEALDRGIAALLAQVAAVPGLSVVCFATNSARLPSAVPSVPGLDVEYVASARKPLRTAHYLGFPRPGAVVGDQVATDGVLAKRLGYVFLHYRPDPRGAPLGPALLSRTGDLIRPFLFAQR